MPELPWRLRRFAQVQALVAAVIVAGVVVWPSGAAATEGCLLVFGHGRNFEPAEVHQNRMWDQVNLSFNQGVAQALEAAGQPAVAMVLKTSATDLESNQRLLLEKAAASACSQVLETTVFADPGAQTLAARLRLYPLLGAMGPRLATALPKIGPPSFSSQREFEFTQTVLDRFRPGPLGREMAVEALQLLKP